MSDVKEHRDKELQKYIKYIVSHRDYEKYINCYKIDDKFADIEEPILTALQKGMYSYKFI